MYFPVYWPCAPTLRNSTIDSEHFLPPSPQMLTLKHTPPAKPRSSSVDPDHPVRHPHRLLLLDRQKKGVAARLLLRCMCRVVAKTLLQRLQRAGCPCPGCRDPRQSPLRPRRGALARVQSPGHVPLQLLRRHQKFPSRSKISLFVAQWAKGLSGRS